MCNILLSLSIDAARLSQTFNLAHPAFNCTMKMRNGRLIYRRKNCEPAERCHGCLIFPRTSAGVFHLRARLGIRGGRRNGGRSAEKSTRAARTHGFLRDGRAVNKFAIFPGARSAHPTPAPATIFAGRTFFFFFSLSISLLDDAYTAQETAARSEKRDGGPRLHG